jgi:hypothetical protein
MGPSTGGQIFLLNWTRTTRQLYQEVLYLDRPWIAASNLRKTTLENLIPFPLERGLLSRHVLREVLVQGHRIAVPTWKRPRIRDPKFFRVVATRTFPRETRKLHSLNRAILRGTESRQ